MLNDPRETTAARYVPVGSKINVRPLAPGSGDEVVGKELDHVAYRARITIKNSSGVCRTINFGMRTSVTWLPAGKEMPA